MTVDEARELWARFQAGDAMTPDEETELLRLFEKEDRFREEILADVRTQGLLQTLGTAAEDEAYVHSFFERLDAERDESRFIRKVESAIPPRRVRVRRRRADGAPARVFFPIFAAAALLFALALILAVADSTPDAPVVRAPDPAMPAEQPPPAPFPARPPAPDRPRPKAPAPKPEIPKEDDRERKRRIEGEMRRSAPRPQPPKATPPPATPEPAAPTTTLTAVARLDSPRGRVRIVTGGEAKPAREGQAVLEGAGVETEGAGSRVVVAYPDGTRLALGPDTAVRKLSAAGGKRVDLSRGSVQARVARQPRALPMVFRTPHGEATVLGTTLRLIVDPARSTRLNVTEGRVRLTRLADGRSVVVTAGHTALAAPGVTLKARSLRARTGLVALYRFEEGRGDRIRDVSRVSPPLDLMIPDPSAVRWGFEALELRAPVRITSGVPATKIVRACRRTGEVTLEAWVRPAALRPYSAPDPGRIIAYSADQSNNNFVLEQGIATGRLDRVYHSRLRTTETNSGGWPKGVRGFPSIFNTPVGSLDTRLTHVVMTRRSTGEAFFYLDGEEKAFKPIPGSFDAWNPSYALHLGGEVGDPRFWLGALHLVAIYNRALTPAEVEQHFRAGGD